MTWKDYWENAMKNNDTIYIPTEFLGVDVEADHKNVVPEVDEEVIGNH